MKKKAFTLIEMLIAAAIFATVIVIVAAIFGSSSQLQTATSSAIKNQQLASNISEKLFNDLKSANGWGLVTAKLDNTPVDKELNIKGFAFFEYSSTGLKLKSTVDLTDVDLPNSNNLIIAFKDNSESVTAICYYFNGNEIYRLERDYSKNGPSSPKLPVKSGNLPLGMLTDSNNQLTAIGSKVSKFYLYGHNYISIKQSSAILPNYKSEDVNQPLLNYKLIFTDTDIFGNLGLNEIELNGSVSGRNYQNEP